MRERVHLAQGDLLQPAPSGLDAICANLPYVAEDADLPAEVLVQPRQALFGGDRLVRRLLEEAPGRLAPGGVVFAEIDPAIAGGLSELAGRTYAKAVVHKDLAGLERVLVAWKS